MKIIALGTSQFLVACVHGFIKSGHDVICLVSEPSSKLPVNSIKIEEVARDLNIPYYETGDINSRKSRDFLSSLQSDYIFSAWARIIKEDVLLIPRFGVIGTHPTPLPFNRGRHPLHWQIVLGVRESALSFFKMEKGIDSGDILLQVPYRVYEDDTIRTLSDRVNELAFDASQSVGKVLASEDYHTQGKAQNHLVANTWRKRTSFDVTIDFRMTGSDILSLVRSFTAPFSGALIVNENAVYHVTEGVKIDSGLIDHSLYMEHGRILQVEDHLIRVKAADCILDLKTEEKLDESLKSQRYFHPPLRYISANPELLKIFA